MHLEAAAATPGDRACAECGTLFAPRRPWQERCSKKCRNDFHGRERRKRAIEARAMVMFEALTKIAEGHNDPIGVNSQLAAEAIKDLKAP